MFAEEEGYGYDALFTSEVQEYLKCVVCHLVLRNPVQIMKCGHHFCQPCFERIKSYSLHLNTELCCPIDRDVVNLNEVFTDAAMGRIVGNLEAKCRNNEIGCSWSDDLRYLQKHEEQCEHKVKKDLEDLSLQKQKEEDTAALVKGLCIRLDTCEIAMMEKEKEVAHLKYTLHELRTNFKEEINLLKKKAVGNEDEVKQMKNLNQEIKVQFERSIQTLMNKNELMEGKVSGLEKQLFGGGKILEDKKDETSSKDEMEEVKKLNEQVNLMSSEIKDVACQCAKQESSMNEKLVKLQEQIDKHLVDKDNSDHEDTDNDKHNGDDDHYNDDDNYDCDDHYDNYDCDDHYDNDDNDDNYNNDHYDDPWDNGYPDDENEDYDNNWDHYEE